MSYTDTFYHFQPQFVCTQADLPADFVKRYHRLRLLVCGELHGAIENAHVLYSLVTLLGCDTLAIERSEAQVGAFMSTILEGEPDFSLINPDIFGASVLSVEMAKTIFVLHQESKIQRIAYIDTASSDIEQGLADNLLALPEDKPTIAVMGNWHTEPQPVPSDEGMHESALRRVRQSRHALSVQYRYGKGQYFNAYAGLTTLEPDDSIRDIRIIAKSHDDYDLHIPVAHAITID